MGCRRHLAPKVANRIGVAVWVLVGVAHHADGAVAPISTVNAFRKLAPPDPAQLTYLLGPRPNILQRLLVQVPENVCLPASAWEDLSVDRNAKAIPADRTYWVASRQRLLLLLPRHSKRRHSPRRAPCPKRPQDPPTKCDSRGCLPSGQAMRI